MNLGPTRFMSDESHFLLTAVDLPVVSWVAEATEEISCLVLSLKFEHVHGPGMEVFMLEDCFWPNDVCLRTCCSCTELWLHTFVQVQSSSV